MLYFFSKIWKLSCPHFSIESIIGISDNHNSDLKNMEIENVSGPR